MFRFLLILSAVFASGCISLGGQRYVHFATPTPVPAGDVVVLGFMGGRDSWRNTEVGVGRLAQRLRDLSFPGTHIETVENKKRGIALELVRKALDRNHDGVLDSQERERARVIVYGQSFGGAAVVKFARQLEEIGVPVLLTVQVDSVGRGDGVIPRNVRTAANLFQDDGLIIQGESEVRAADPARTEIIGNFRFTYDGSDIDISDLSWFKKIGRVAHARMDRDPRVWTLVERLVLDALAEARNPADRRAALHR